jgi:aryl-phospho-beta-D-glucosidase BglC (GH1 family)
MTTFRRTLLFAFAISLAVSSRNSAAQSVPMPAAATPTQRLSHLRRGINLSEWFAQVYDARGYTKEHLRDWTTAEDIALLQKMGFDHVRLSVNPAPMFRHGHADEIPADYLGYLDAAVKMILDHGLAVVIDIHPDSDFKQKLVHEDSFVEEFADYWRAFARHYANLDPDRVFFEILNEPEMSDRYRWYGVEAKVAAAIREGAPQHTIIAAGARWSDDDDLVFLEPLRDSNVIYNFHFYDPHIFTHQGATWGVSYWHFVHGLAYPSNAASAAAAAASVPDEMNRLAVIRYGMDHWDAARMDTEIAQVAEWARQRGLAVTCNEFGVYRKAADPADRARWLTDVRSALEKHNIGWAMWDYSGGFGVVTKQNGKAMVDEATVKALGLKMP